VANSFLSHQRGI
jgi:hypothetical protein